MRIKDTLLPLAMPFLFMACSLFKEVSPNFGDEYESPDFACRDTGTTRSNFLHSDSIDVIIKHADKVVLYEMAGLVVDSNRQYHSKDSLFSYRIERNLGSINREMQSILTFIIDDTLQYTSNYTPIRQPFHPDIVIEFIHKKRRAYYYMSFATREVAISDERGFFKFYLFENLRLLLRWTHIILPDNNYFNQ